MGKCTSKFLKIFKQNTCDITNLICFQMMFSTLLFNATFLLRAFIYKTECYAKFEWNTECDPFILQCYSDERKQEWKTKDNATWARIEKSYTDVGYDFSYAETCKLLF